MKRGISRLLSVSPGLLALCLAALLLLYREWTRPDPLRLTRYLNIVSSEEGLPQLLVEWSFPVCLVFSMPIWLLVWRKRDLVFECCSVWLLNANGLVIALAMLHWFGGFYARAIRVETLAVQGFLREAGIAGSSEIKIVRRREELRGFAGPVIFENNNSAVGMLGESPQLAKVTEYYRARGIPFDPSEGLKLDKISRISPKWIREHEDLPKRGLIPNHSFLAKQAADDAEFYWSRGLYRDAVGRLLDELGSQPKNVFLGVRLTWMLAAVGRPEEASLWLKNLDSLAIPGYLEASLQEVRRTIAAKTGIEPAAFP